MAVVAGCTAGTGGDIVLVRPSSDAVQVSPFHAIAIAHDGGELGLTDASGPIAVDIETQGEQSWITPLAPLPFGTEITVTLDGGPTDQTFATADPAARFVGTVGDLAAAADASRPGSGSEAYSVPSEGELESFRVVVDRFLEGDWDVDAELAELGYRWEATEDDGRWRVVLWEPAPSLHRGAYLFAFDAQRGLVVQAPHPEYDSTTGDQAKDALLALDAAALFLAGAHRCANGEASGCDGSSGSCGTSVYAISDAAHSERSFFQVAHERTHAAWPQSIAVQLHGFSWDGNEPAAYVSDGTTVSDNASISRAIRDALNNSLVGYSAASCNDSDESSRLCGTTNTQGRASNGSADTCETSASIASGRFVHLEQARVLRTDERTAVLDALQILVPPPPNLK